MKLGKRFWKRLIEMRIEQMADRSRAALEWFEAVKTAKPVELYKSKREQDFDKVRASAREILTGIKA